MIDIQILRDNPDLVKQKSAEKRVDVDIDRILNVDIQYRDLLSQVELLRQKRNEISSRMKNGKPDAELIEQGKQLKVELSDREELLEKSKNELNSLMYQVPNLHFDDVPVGVEGEGVEVSRFGDCETTGGIDHQDFATARGWLDFEGGAKVAGAKFYFLKGDLALLENAILQYAIELVTKENFQYITVPHLVNSRTAQGAGFSPRSDKEGNEYFVEGEDLSLIATAEMPLTGLHADDIIDEDKLPILYAGYSACYRREAGTYGKHTRGLFRVHQFNKLELYAFCSPDKSAEMHQRILSIEERIWQEIGIPYHVINIPSGDLGAPAAKKYDIEYWSTVDGAFRELTSCSNCTDFQTRNLNIRVRRKDGNIELAHSLNGTAVSMARTLVAVIEHYQNPDGTLRIPQVIQKYMGGRQTI
ncbi:serine--tRNA ligase [Candidatus Saccharibacteria bacterium]|nr:serine--tRNA ligase [Candidatus Saccharibacteria bacterium]